MNFTKQIQDFNNKLDKFKRKLSAAYERKDEAMIKHFNQEIAKVEKLLKAAKGKQTYEIGNKGSAVLKMPFKRVLTKQEQADMGALKKSVKGLIVVHPMTALGRDLGVKEVTGYAPKPF
ncbi:MULTISPECIES: YibL family ribosome-associated protein [unclassified Motilimonas]|uniref:YibL family ribosome-associated protein n=1 Tax=Motilimonas TaxID=1914248 RepID=UPI001E6338C4|nr:MULTISPECIES: YibL family ribosome-associated protein [unclassified Motilimonas]MCE0555377.1 YibL family ribosome-associated protein [Motilimonas sp. E26]MDO6527154.1 YibL family ribosome-associated protein [Motilimonas sp. 1_MG-2023]